MTSAATRSPVSHHCDISQEYLLHTTLLDAVADVTHDEERMKEKEKGKGTQ
jgi:hypothetical protein